VDRSTLTSVWLLVALLLLSVAGAAMQAGELPPPEHAVVVAIDHDGFWRPTHWGHEDGAAQNCALTQAHGKAHFIVRNENCLRTWIHYFDSPVPHADYPILVIRYRARNLTPKSYHLWLDDGSGPNSGGFTAVPATDIVADDQVHEIRRNLGPMNKRKGDITGMALKVWCGPSGPGELELLDMRFEAEATTRPAGAVQTDSPISLRVVDEKGQPLAGATVSVSGDWANWAQSAQSDADGKAQVTPLLCRDAKRSVRVSMPDRATIAVTPKDGEPWPQQVTLPQAVRYGGIVKNEQGEPIAGATISIHISMPNDQSVTLSSREAVAASDDEGKWRTDPLPANVQSLALRLSHPDYLSDPYYSTSRASMDSLRAGDAQIVMKRGLVLTGVVVDDQGSPISGVQVRQGSDRWGTNHPSTTTDADGIFRLKQVAPGEAIVTAQKSGFAPEVLVTNIGPETKPLRVQLGKGSTIRGRVLDGNGQPIAGVHVTADTWRGYRTISWSSRTDAEGRFAWNNAPGDSVTFRVYKSGYMQNEPTLEPGDQEHLITLQFPLRIHGKVIDAETREPLKSFTVVPGIDWGNGQQPHWERHNAQQQADGTYSLTFNYPRAGHFVRVEAQGYIPAASRSVAGDEGDVEINIELKKGKGLAGTVFQPDGKPAAGAKVILATPSQSAYIKNGREIQGYGCPTATTNQTGRFEFPPQMDPWQIVVVHDTGYGELGEKDASSLDIKLQPWGRVEVSNIGKSKVADGVAISMMYSFERDQPRVHHGISAASADKNGLFIFDRVPPGKAQVSRIISEGNRQHFTHPEFVEIQPGQTVSVRLGSEGRPVVGVIEMPPGKQGATQCEGHLQGVVDIDYPLGKPPKRPRDWDRLDSAAKAELQEQYKLFQEKYTKWFETDEGKAWRQKMEDAHRRVKHFPVIVAGDGSFRVEDVPAGAYQLHMYLQPASGDMGGSHGRLIAMLEEDVVIPQMPPGGSDEPLDLGTLCFKTLPQTEATAPEPTSRQAVPAGGPVALVNKPMPSLDEFNIQPALNADGKRLVLCLWDMQQRPSRHCVQSIAKRANELQKAGVIVAAVDLSGSSPQALSQWLSEQKITMHSGQAPAGAGEKVASAWGAKRRPWLILVDKQGVVRIEGFDLAQLDEVLKTQ
jgi:uncharacterized GH25 family protein